VYIGSAVDLQMRLHKHSLPLRENRHPNKKLQHAWNKYGADAFEVRVVEYVPDVEVLIEREQFWLDVTQAVKNGYNIAPKAGSQLGVRYDEESLELASKVRAKPMQGFITPEGYPITILNLGLFCRRSGLTTNVMRMLVTGKATSHKGWSHVNAKQPEREWISTYAGFIDPNGAPVAPITNLEQFCAEHGLIASNMNKVYRGKKPSHKGWTHVQSVSKRHAAKRVRTYYGFIDPSGQQVVITNLTKFCRDNSLDQPTLYKVLTGDPRYSQHKGWTYDPSREKEG
jgi:group I intron endonuclease